MSDFDRNIDQAWADYRNELADALSTLQKGESITASCGYASRDCDSDCSPRLVFTATASRRIRCSIPPICNPFRGVPFGEMAELGWKMRQSGWHELELGRRWADKLAVNAVHVLRDIWQIPHPAFLGDAPAEPVVHVAIEPLDRKHLQSLVEAAIQQVTSDQVRTDHDGDLRFEIGDISSWLHVREDDNCIEFFTMLASSICNPDHAAKVICDHSRYWPDIKLVLAEDKCFASLRIDASTFVALNMQACFAKWVLFMRRGAGSIADDLTPPLGGGDDPDAANPPALDRLLQIDAQNETPDAHAVATICDNDYDAITRYIEICSEQVSLWRRSALEAKANRDSAEFEASRFEARGWARTLGRLREAQRVVGPARGRPRGQHGSDARTRFDDPAE